MSTIKFKGKTVKFKYEVALKQHVKGSVDDDYESVDFITASSYKQAVKTAMTGQSSSDLTVTVSKRQKLLTLDWHKLL